MNTRYRAGSFVVVVLALFVALALVAVPAESAPLGAIQLQMPTIKSFSPKKAVVGTLVRIKGSNLQGTTQVTFNGKPAKSFTATASLVTAVVASGTTTGAISITTPDGVAASAKVFTVKIGVQLWAARYNGPGKAFDYPAATVASPDGAKVYVVGWDSSKSGPEFATIAYSAGSGKVLWKSHFTGGLPSPSANSVALSPDGTHLVVGGDWQFGSAMVVYDAATGQELWSTTSSGDDSLPHRTAAVAVSPDGTTAFLTGYEIVSDFNHDYDTVAYDITTGAQLWKASYDGAGSVDDPTAMLVSGDGTKVFVTGISLVNSDDYGTVAYDAETGEQLWAATYDGGGSIPLDLARALAVSPDGTKLFVTGNSCDESCTYFDYATVAYDTAGGDQLWVRRLHGPTGDDMARAIAVTPDGTRVVVTGNSAGTDYPSVVTIAYSAATGDSLWANRSTPDVAAYGSSIGVSPDGTRIFVAGSRVANVNDDYATVEYDALTGQRLWAAAFAGRNSNDQTTGLAVAPDGTKVFVTGYTESKQRDWMTIVYST